MSNVDDYETSCHVWDVDWQTAEDDSFPRAVFNINIQATLTVANADNLGEDEDDESSFMHLDSVSLENTAEVRVEQLMNNGGAATASSTVRHMLALMGIPFQDFIVDKILDCAHRMTLDERYRFRKVLRMRVEIEAVVDQLDDYPSMMDVTADDHQEEEEEDWSRLKNWKVVIEKPNTCCSICLEDFLVGTEAMSTPCSHVFHAPCILQWLSKKKLCPLCRADLSNT